MHKIYVVWNGYYAHAKKKSRMEIVMDEIRIKSSRIYIVPTILVAVITFFSFVEVVSNPNEASIILLFTMCIALVLSVRLTQINCRTIIFNEDGCNIVRGKKNVKYTWEDIMIRRVEKYGFSLMKTWDEAVFFSTGKLKKPIKMQPDLFNIFTNEFKYFFVYLVPENVNKTLPNNHVCPKNEFIQKTLKWGVNIEGVSLNEKVESKRYLASNEKGWKWIIIVAERGYQIHLNENKTRKTFEIYINEEKVYEQKRARTIWLGLDYRFQIEDKNCRIVFDVINWEIDFTIDNKNVNTGEKYISKIKGLLELSLIIIVLLIGILLIHIGVWWLYIPFIVMMIGMIHLVFR